MRNVANEGFTDRHGAVIGWFRAGGEGTLEASRLPRTDLRSERWRALFGKIGDFLVENLLEPTPLHFELAYAYVNAPESETGRRVDDAIRQDGRLTPTAAAGILALRAAELSAADLTRAAEDAQAHLRQISAIVERSGNDTREYSVALARIAGSGSGSPSASVEGLIGVTRAMIEKTRTVEEDLRRSGEEVAQLRESLAEARRTADTDPLTGLPNRRALDTRLREAFETARTSKRPLSLAICDIDQFKAVNDVHGHHIGDEVIKFIAGALSNGDVERLFVARYGGEEFVMLFENMDPSTAAAEIDRIRSDIAAREFKVTATGRQLGRLSFSAGIAGLAGRKGPTAILKSADAALYRAKQEGRNRVCIAD